MLCLTDLHTEQIRARAKKPSSRVASARDYVRRTRMYCVCTLTNPQQRLQQTSLFARMDEMVDVATVVICCSI